MNLLIVGSSSSIAGMIIENLISKKNIKIFTLGRRKLINQNHCNIKDYSENSINLALKKFEKKQIKFDAVIFFNGYQKFSTLSFFDSNLFLKIIKINVIIPFRTLSLLIKKNILRINSSVIFVGSLAASLNEVGNAYYSLAKSILNKSIQILVNEQKGKYRFNIVSLGMVKNKMSNKMIENFPGNFKNKDAFIDKDLMLKKFRKILFDKKKTNTIIKIHGKYKN